MLKGQDIAILIKLLLKNNTKEKIEFKSIAHELYISQSEVTKSIKRLEATKLLTRYSDDSIELHKHELMEFFVHSVKYHFPAEINIATRGMPAAYSLTPIYKTLPNALDRSSDENFYAIISALDLIRLGGKRENQIAKELLEHFVWNQ